MKTFFRASPTHTFNRFPWRYALLCIKWQCMLNVAVFFQINTLLEYLYLIYYAILIEIKDKLFWNLISTVHRSCVWGSSNVLKKNGVFFLQNISLTTGRRSISIIMKICRYRKCKNTKMLLHVFHLRCTVFSDINHLKNVLFRLDLYAVQFVRYVFHDIYL